jgi:flagellar basal-body rod protein FlgB
MLRNAIAGASLNHAAIANNVANANTPNYRRQTVPFKDALAATQPGQPDPEELTLVTTSDRHIGGLPAPQPFRLEASADENTQMRPDRSNVDIDQEMALLSQNAGYSATMSQLLQNQYTRLRQSITGGF